MYGNGVRWILGLFLLELSVLVLKVVDMFFQLDNLVFILLNEFRIFGKDVLNLLPVHGLYF